MHERLRERTDLMFARTATNKIVSSHIDREIKKPNRCSCFSLALAETLPTNKLLISLNLTCNFKLSLT